MRMVFTVSTWHHQQSDCYYPQTCEALHLKKEEVVKYYFSINVEGY